MILGLMDIQYDECIVGLGHSLCDSGKCHYWLIGQYGPKEQDFSSKLPHFFFLLRKCH